MQITGAKGGSQKQHTPVQQPDTVASTNVCRLLMALGEGEYAGGLDDTKIYFNDTPLGNADGSRNFDGVTWEFRPGTQAQEPIKGFPAVESETQVGLALTKAQPWTHLFSNTQIDAVIVRVEIASLMKQVASGDNAGDINGTTVQFHVELSTDGAAYQTVLEVTKTDMISQAYSASYRINLPKATASWQMRVVRDTPDSTDVTLSNKTNLIAFTEVIDANLRYPHTALLFVSFDAKAFQSTPKVSCKVKGRIVQVPANYDPVARTYNGTWDGTFKWAWTNNPAWVWFDILTQKRFGLGRRVTPAMLDKWELYKIAQRCDAKVPDGKGGTGTEPRFLYDVYIQAQADAWQVIRDIAAGFNGLTYWGNNMFNVVTDMPYDKTTMQVLTRAAVVGQPTYSSGSERNRYSSAVVNYSDPSNLFNDASTAAVFPELVKQFKFKQLSLTAIGCTRESEAQRRGSWAVYSNYLDEMLTVTTGMDGYKFTPGTVFAFADERVSGKVYGGRVVSYNPALRLMKLDRGTSAVVGDIFMVRTGGGFVEQLAISAVNGDQITIGQAFMSPPDANAVFVIDSNQLRLQYFRVTKQEFKNSDNQYTITAAQYNDSKYDAVDFNARLDTPNISAIPTGLVSPVTNITVDSYEPVSQGQRITTMRATWDAPVRNGKIQQDVIGYRMQWRRGDNAWVNAPETGLREFEVPGIYEGDYLVRVQAFTSGGASSLWTTSALTHLKGRQGNVPTPLNFKGTPELWGITWSWAFGADTGDSAFTEIEYSLVQNGNPSTLLSNVPYPATNYKQMGLKAGAEIFARARLTDKSGNTSAWTTWTAGEASSDADAYLDAIRDQVMSSDAGKALTSRVDDVSDDVEALNTAVSDMDAKINEITGGSATSIAEVVSQVQTLSDESGQMATKLDAVIAKAADNTAAIGTESTARADADTALGQRVDQVKATADDAAASVASIVTAQVDADKALTTVIKNNESSYIATIETALANDKDSKDVRYIVGDTVTSKIVPVLARITETEQTVADNSQAFAQYQQTVTAQFGDVQNTTNGLRADVQTTATALADVTGKVSAQWGIKLGVTSGGRYYAAGMGIGIDNSSGIVQSDVSFLADRFTIMSDIAGTPRAFFALVGGQVFMDSAFIQNASINGAKIVNGAIDNAKIATVIQSNDWASNGTGWNLDKNSGFSMRAIGSGGSMTLDSRGLRIYDGSGNWQVKVGDLS